MKLFFSLFIFFTLTICSLSQQLQVEKEFSSIYYEFNGFEINLNEDLISISKNNQNFYLESIAGKKVFLQSPVGNYFMISNYQFSTNKVDYPIEIRVFDRDGELVYPFKFFAPFDLPHSLMSINDNGILALFDPLTFKVKLIGEETNKEVELEKDVPFEMEKASFMETNEDFLFILTSQSALDITETASNVKLYRVNLFDQTVHKKEIDYNTPTMLKIIGGYVFVSGVKFENLKPVGKLIKYDLQLNELFSNDKIIEKLISHENGFYGKYFNVIYDLKNDLSITKEKRLPDGERISDIIFWNEKIVGITNKLGEYNIYYFMPDFNVDFKSRLNIFNLNKVNDFSISGSTLIIHHDSKSFKLKLN